MNAHRPHARPRYLRLLALLVGAGIVVGVFLGVFGNASTVQDAFGAPATITGKVDIVITNKAEAYAGAVAQCDATIHLPDGSTQTATGRCISGDHYAVPHDGTYDYVGTLQADGTYSIVIHSQVSAGANADAFEPGEMWGTQQMGDIRITYKPEVRVTFNKTSANLEITNGNPSYSLAGATYDIHLAKTGAKITSITTDEKGAASIMLEADTDYFAIETKAPQGFTLNTQRIPFTTGSQPATVELDDTPGSVTINLAKVDDATKGGAQSGASLAGAEFLVRSNSTSGWGRTAKTDAHGRALLNDIPLGDITITETKAPEGYLPLTSPITHTVEAGQLTDAGTFELKARVEEAPIAFDIDIVKYLDSGAEQSGLQRPGVGISFEIISNSTKQVVGTLTTDKRGRASTADPATVNKEAISSDKTHDPGKPWMGSGKRTERIAGALPYDKAGYTVREVASTVPEGYRPCPDWTISPDQMANDIELDFIVDNDFVSSRIQVVKTDAASGLTIPLAGFSFQLLDDGKNPIEQEVWHPNHTVSTSFTTDESGSVTFPTPLKPGTYYVREVEAAEPYLLAGEEIKVIIPDNGTTPPITLVRFEDDAAKGVARIHKVCTDEICPREDDAQKDETGLSGAEFDVIAQEDIVSPDGTVQAAAGSIVDHVVTGDDGWATTKRLPLGSGEADYAFVETVPPAGHVLDASPRPFTLTYTDDATETITVEVEVSDTPNELKLVKTDASSGDALAHAKFALWRQDEEVSVHPGDTGALAIRSDGDTPIRAQFNAAYSTISLEAPDGLDVTLLDEQGAEHAFEQGEARVARGTYTVAAKRGDELIDLKDNIIEVRGNAAYRLSIRPGPFGAKVTCDQTGSACAPIELEYSEADGAHLGRDLAAGTWELFAGKDSLGYIELSGGASYYTIEDGRLAEQPVLLSEGHEPSILTTGDDGTFNVKHLLEGGYRIREVAAPAGFILDRHIESFNLDAHGLIEGQGKLELAFANSCTEVEISKRDSDTELPVEGAELLLLDAGGNVVDSWTTSTEAHHIQRLPAGSYTIREAKAPQGHDKAEDVAIEVLPIADVQTFTMYDAPLSIAGQVDKRQQIADPVAPNTGENGDGKNRADVTASPQGLYSYTIDARNMSGTWVDEFTITDELLAVTDGLAILEGVTTPQAQGDYDGTLNVWFTTTKEHAGDEDKANATLDDGHENPWLSDPSTVDAIGEDGRALPYAGWRLWSARIPASIATHLPVSELDLEEGEVVTAVRFEYGSVDKTFTTRSNGWGGEDIKNPHDDFSDRGDGEARGGRSSAAKDGELRPTLIHMRVTDAYVAGTSLNNQARVDLYRNGGGEGLEDHDEDRVTQTPRALERAHEDLAQTGTAPMTPVFAVAACLLGAAAVIFKTRR